VGERAGATAASRVDGGRAVARAVKVAAAVGAVAALGVFAALARATHPGKAKLTSAPAPPALTAPRSFVRALDSGITPGAVSAATGPAQAVSGGS
jgi:hypothetical protein